MISKRESLSLKIMKAWQNLSSSEKSNLLYKLYESNRKNKYLYFTINDKQEINFTVVHSEKELFRKNKPILFYGVLYEVEKKWQSKIIIDWKEILGVEPPKEIKKDDYPSIKAWATEVAKREGYKTLNAAIASWVVDILYDNFDKTVSDIIKDVIRTFEKNRNFLRRKQMPNQVINL